MSSPDTLNQILDLVRLAWPESAQDINEWSDRFILADGLIVEPTSLDSFARVLRAMPPEVRERFDGEVTKEAQRGRSSVRITERPSVTLTTDPATLWPLLHRAAFPDGVKA